MKMEHVHLAVKMVIMVTCVTVQIVAFVIVQDIVFWVAEHLKMVLSIVIQGATQFA